MSSAVHFSCDTAAAQSAPLGKSISSHPRLVLSTTILASSLAFVDGSVVNVGLPAISRTLGSDPGSLQWVVNAYLLPLSALILLGGAAGDRFGQRRLLIAGTALFALASLGCALAPEAKVLVAFRLLQGVAAAMLMPNSLAILGATFSGEAKGRAIGVWAATGAATAAIGPVVGGWLIDVGSWRAIFLLNLPLAAGAIILALCYVPHDKSDSARTLDWGGGVLVTLGLGTLTLALTLGSGQGGWRPGTLAMTFTASAFLVLFVVVEARLKDRAMMPLAMFSSASFVGLTLLTLFLYAAMGELFVLLPYMLIKQAHYVATAAGAALVPLPLVLAIMSPLMGNLAGRIGPRLPLAVGSLVVAVGFFLGCRISAEANYWSEVLPAILVVAIGMSGAVAPLTTAVLDTVDRDHAGSASGFNSAAARTGALVATALLGFVLPLDGSLFLKAFHLAMIAGAASCVAAAASAFVLIKNPVKSTQ